MTGDIYHYYDPNSTSISSVSPYDNSNANSLNAQNSGSILTSINNISSNLSNLTSITYSDKAYDSCDSLISITGDYITKVLAEERNKMILGEIEDFCKNYCFMGIQEICDSDCKCNCPLWNRLKCEKRV